MSGCVASGLGIGAIQFNDRLALFGSQTPAAHCDTNTHHVSTSIGVFRILSDEQW
jgi:hypothetical protein